jgi:hypothetical protein
MDMSFAHQEDEEGFSEKATKATKLEGKKLAESGETG